MIVIGYFAVSSSLANVIARVDPSRAAELAGGNGAIIGEAAEYAFAQAPEKDPNSTAAVMAKRALLADPTAVGALTVLGMQAQLRGDSAQSDAIFAYSTNLSRRELRPRIWAIEKAAMAGDIEGALRNYDIALRTSGDARAILFPTLSAALGEQRIRAGILKILVKHPVWEEDFLDYVARSGANAEGAVALFREGRSVGVNPTDDNRAALVTTLAFQNKHELAWSYYKTLRPGAPRDRSRDPNFERTVGRTEFDWQEGADTRIAAAIARDGAHGRLELAVPPNLGGEAISQTELFAPGVYYFEGVSRGLVQAKESQPYWTLTCQDGRELGRVVVPNSDLNGGSHSGRFIVPQGCPVQRLSLMIRASDDIAGVNGQILNAQLRPAQ